MELLDVLNEDGQPTGQTKARSNVHRDGDWHRAAHVWIVNQRGELLLQKRSPTKDSHPNMWDISVAGHVPAGTNSLLTAVREAKEELGVNLAPEECELLFSLKESSTTNGGTFINNTIKDVYLVQKDLQHSDISLQTEEVSDVMWIPFQDLQKKLAANDPTILRHDEEYRLLFAELSNRFGRS